MSCISNKNFQDKKMFIRILCVVALTAISMESSAQTLLFVDNYTIVKKDSNENITSVSFQKSVTKNSGVYSWAQTSTLYREVYAGPYAKINDVLQVGIGGGVDGFGKIEGRISTFAYAAKGKHSVFANYGDGGTGPWYIVQTKYAATSRLALGVHSEKFVGHGVRGEFVFPIGDSKWTPSLWSSVFWDKTTGARPNVMIGIRATYFKGD